MNHRNSPGFAPNVGIMITTCAKDAHWLVHCLQSLEKFARGFDTVTVVLPEQEVESVFSSYVRPMMARFENIYVVSSAAEEKTSKGMIEHMIAMAHANDHTGSSYVAHIDADCVLTGPLKPVDLFIGDNPYYIYRDYDALLEVQGSEPGKKVVSDCFQWKQPTEIQLGMPIQAYTMCRFPFVFPRHFYQKYRAAVQRVHGTYEAWMRKGKNEFPQNRMDFTAMGAYAFEHMHDEFTWLNADRDEFPLDPVKAYWSHGGITPQIEAELKGLLA